MAKIGKGRLASALAKHQLNEREKQIKKQKLNSQQINYPDKSNKSNKANKPNKIKKLDESTKKTFIPFETTDKILLIGEGDFSYSLSIVKQGLIKTENLIATSFDSEEVIIEKYTEICEKNLQMLKELGVKILFEIDGTKLIKSLKLSENLNKFNKNISILGGLTINNIIFNFPHIGKSIKDQDRNIALNQKMLVEFFESCKDLFKLLKYQRFKLGNTKQNVLSATKEHDYYLGSLNKDKKPSNEQTNDLITISIFSGEPYESWQVKKLIRESIGYKVQRSGRFDWEFFKDYHHRRTGGMGKTNKEASEREARIYKFEKYVTPISDKKRKRDDESDSDSDD